MSYAQYPYNQTSQDNYPAVEKTRLVRRQSHLPFTIVPRAEALGIGFYIYAPDFSLGYWKNPPRFSA